MIINQRQMAISDWSNCFSNQFGDAIQVRDEKHHVAFWQLLLTAVPLVAASAIATNLIEHEIASKFTRQW